MKMIGIGIGIANWELWLVWAAVGAVDSPILDGALLTLAGGVDFVYVASMDR